MATSNLMANAKQLWNRSPILRGMLSYSMIWPTSVLIQETVISGRSFREIEWAKCVRFSLYGGFFVAPTLYAWVRVSSAMWSSSSLKTGILKALVETCTYTPAAMTSFYFIMTLLEGRGARAGCAEVSEKFWPTYRVAICVWPAVATVNFTLVPERNRVPFISVCSLIWTCFLAYMKQHAIGAEEGAMETKKAAV